MAALAATQRKLIAMSVEKICSLWNSWASSTGADELDVVELAATMGTPLGEGECPFAAVFYWSAFSLWGA